VTLNVYSKSNKIRKDLIQDAYVHCVSKIAQCLCLQLWHCVNRFQQEAQLPLRNGDSNAFLCN